MKVKITSSVELSPAEISRVMRTQLENMSEHGSQWLSKGRVMRNERDWRHGSIEEEEVKFKDAASRKAMIEYLLWREKVRKAADTLLNLLDEGRADESKTIP